MGESDAPLSKMAAAAVAHLEVTVCHDRSSTCAHWVETGECKKNFHWMKDHCTQSCGLCSSVGVELQGTRVKCIDKYPDCKYWKRTGECEKNPGYMLSSCWIY